MKLWSKEATATSESVESFSVGNDRMFDALLAPFDVEASMAHAAMLAEQQIISVQEGKELIAALEKIMKEVSEPGFQLPESVEDIHSYVEWLLTERIGEAGKKIHTGRSRNDQVAVDIKLYLRNEVHQIKQEVTALFSLLLQLSEKYKQRLMPGYTHLQVAMPSSAGLWLSAYAESLVDDLELLAAAFAITNKNPLGSGAGFGSSFNLNRKSTTQKLGFKTLNWNSAYAQMTRGKTEKAVAVGMSSIASTLGRLAYDCCLYMNANHGFISFPDELTTGSSIMPHKKNPDVLELIRAKCNRIQATPNELALLTINLPGGYHRDLQLTKEILFPAIQQLKECIRMMRLMLAEMEVKEDLLKEEKYKYIFTVEAMNDLVRKGVPYRDAYRQIGNDVEKGIFQYDFTQLHHTHEGSIGNLCLEEIAGEMDRVLKKFE